MSRMAHGKLTIAKKRVCHTYPLLGDLVDIWHPRSAPVSTIGLGFGEEGFELLYNDEYIASLTIVQVTALLLHLVLHLLLGHITMDPEEFPDEVSLVTAQEVTANEGLSEVLPAGAMVLEDFRDLPPGEDTKARYRRLKRRKRRKPIATVKPIDDHSHWQELRENEPLVRSLLQAALEEALAAGAGAGNGKATASQCHDGNEASGSPGQDSGPSIDAVLEQACRAWGVGAGQKTSQLSPAPRTGGPDWRVLLRRYVGRELERRPSYARPPRRFPHLLGIIPGTIRASAKPTVVAVIDTSGSMTDAVLSGISTELRYLARKWKVVVVECDAEIQKVYRYKKKIIRVNGRGGTDFRPPLAAAFLRKQQADLVVYFTDGAGPAPDRAPCVPVVWVLTDEGPAPAPWGRTIIMSR